VLGKNYRSQKQIQSVAAAVNTRHAEANLLFTPLTQVPTGDALRNLETAGGCYLCTQTEAASWRGMLRTWAEYAYLSGAESYRSIVTNLQLEGSDPTASEAQQLDRLFHQVGRTRVLTLVREGLWGSEGINDFLAELVREWFAPRSEGQAFNGKPILIGQNDRARELFNGDVGILLRSRLGLRAVFKRGERFLILPPEVLPHHDSAFAMTVHKSQGSEYDAVLLTLPAQGGRRLLTKEMVYTGLTRARKLVVVASRPEVLRTAVSRRIERDSGLWLEACDVRKASDGSSSGHA
jgi:exodeoxyribonuclease V alpha subunit